MAANRPDSAQLSLIDPTTGELTPARGRRRTGRHERALERTVKAVKLDSEHQLDAAVSLARAAAAGIDRAEHSGTGFELAAVTREYREILDRLGLLPGERGDDDDDDPFGLSGPALDDPTDAG